MIKETTTIVGIESGCLWVEGIQRSTCGTCSARAGCGQRLLAGIRVRASRIRVLLNPGDQTDYLVGQALEIGIPNDVVVKGSLFIYLCPLLSLLFGGAIAEHLFGKEWLTICFGVLGLGIGGLLVQVVSKHLENKPNIQPVVVTATDPQESISTVRLI